VGAGMCMAADMSRRLGWLSEAERERIVRLIARAGLPVRPPQTMSGDQFLALASVDKKVMDGQLRLVLLKGIGKAVITADFDPAALRETVNGY